MVLQFLMLLEIQLQIRYLICLTMSGASLNTNETSVDNAEITVDIGKVLGTKPSHKLTDYEGVAAHPAFGNINFSVRNDSLFARFSESSVWLKHYHYDVFEGMSIDKQTGVIDSIAGGIKFNFQTGVDGMISGVELALEPSIAEPQLFQYSRVYDISESELQKYAGEYELSGGIIIVYIKNGSLYVSVPGQPDYKTTPSGEHRF